MVLLGVLNVKQGSPLEPKAMSDVIRNGIEQYDQHRHMIGCVNKELSGWNETILELRERADVTDATEIAEKLCRLKASKARHSDDIVPLCDDYLNEQQCKATTEIVRGNAREALDNYRTNVFPTLQAGVNRYLELFGAEFRIGSLKHRNTGSGSDCTYNVVINQTPIAVARNEIVSGEPSFRNTLSAGDRTTLALALFFSSLDADPKIADTIVVLDDPKSSLDGNRSLTTVQEIRKLVNRTRQVIVLSHDKQFLCDIWDKANKHETSALEIRGLKQNSTLCEWDIKNDALTEHDRRHQALNEYLKKGSGDEREIAESIRLHLEGYFRVTCPTKLPPGSSLGSRFIALCRQRLGSTSQILEESEIDDLNDILEYAHKIHHATDPASAPVVINSAELASFVSRTLDFIKP